MTQSASSQSIKEHGLHTAVAHVQFARKLLGKIPKLDLQGNVPPQVD